jgi:hypothetical protein
MFLILQKVHFFVLIILLFSRKRKRKINKGHITNNKHEDKSIFILKYSHYSVINEDILKYNSFKPDIIKGYFIPSTEYNHSVFLDWPFINDIINDVVNRENEGEKL